MKTRQNKRNFDLVIQNATIYDGLGDEPFTGSIGITDDRVATISKDRALTGERVIQSAGLSLAPGFIDVHGHSDFSLLKNGQATTRHFQGVTTEICGNCGLSAFPVRELNGNYFKKELNRFQLPQTPSWKDFSDYAEHLDHSGLTMNIIPLIGHGTLREAFNGTGKSLCQSTFTKMKENLESAFEAGLSGFSTGLIYVPGCFAPPEELLELLEIVARHDGIFTTHMRSEGPGLIDAIKETLDLVKKSGVRCQISHLKTSGGPANWPKLERAFSLIEDFKKNGGLLFCDRYPYIRSETFLEVLLPEEFLCEGHEIARERLNNPETRSKLTTWIENLHPEKEYFHRIFIGSIYSGNHPDYFGRSVAELAETINKDPYNFCYDLLVDENFQVEAFFQGMCEENMIRILQKPYVMIGSDSFSASDKGNRCCEKVHPRARGSFNRFFRLIREGQIEVSMAKAIARLTAIPADHFKIRERGRLSEGFFADLVLFDEREICEGNDFTKPMELGRGIKLVVVNGEIVLENGECTENRPGRVIRRSRYKF